MTVPAWDTQPDWTGWTSRLAGIDTAVSTETALMQISTELRRWVGDTSRRRWWQLLGIEVAARPLGASGMLVDPGPPIRLAVNRSDSTQRQSFTVAHEIGHALLDQAGVPHASRGDEERLCERFASELLIPRHALRAALNPAGGLSSPREVLQLADYYNVSLTAMLIALSEVWSDDASCVLLAERAASFGDDRLRIVGGAGSRIKRPAGNPSLEGMGLVALANEPCPYLRSGSDDIHFRYLAGHSVHHNSGTVVGRALWTGLSLKGDRLLFVLNLQHASIKESRPKVTKSDPRQQRLL